MSQKLPLRHALLWIFFSTIVVSGGAALGLLFYTQHLSQRQQDPKFAIVEIISERLEGPQLPNGYFAELLSLSIDRPTNLYHLHLEQARQSILSSPVVKDAEVVRIPPSTLSVRYKAREPIAYLANMTNCAVDEEGVVFPYRPYFSDKLLPVLELGEIEVIWGSKIQSNNMLLAVKMLGQLYGHPVKLLDVTQAYAPSSGKRQIVLGYDDDLLRLRTDDYLTQINHYLILRDSISDKQVIDLRIPQLAYLYDKD